MRRFRARRQRRSVILASALALLWTSLAATLPAGSAEVRYRLAVLNHRDRPPNDHINFADVSRTGRFVAFATFASNMPGPEATHPLYVRDRREGTTRLVSRSSSGEIAGVIRGVISPNGRFVAFCSSASYLVSPDSNDPDWRSWMGTHHPDVDVFVRDLSTGRTRRASTTHAGGEADNWSCDPSVADTGDVAFLSLANNLVRGDGNDNWDAFLYDWSSRSIRRISRRADGREIGTLTIAVSLAGRGRHVAILTHMPISEHDTNGQAEFYVFDREAQRYSRVRRAGGGQLRDGCNNPTSLDISYWGTYLLFSCWDRWIVDPPAPSGPEPLYLLNRSNGRVRHLNKTRHEYSQDARVLAAAVADDGASVMFESDGIGFGGTPTVQHEAARENLFLWRRGASMRLLTPGENIWASPHTAELTGDGRYVLFTSDSPWISDQDLNDPRQTDLFLTTSLR